MEELIKKKNPCKQYETALLPAYLIYQAKKGYLLNSVSGTTLYFEKTQPRELEFQCVLLGNVDYEAKKKEYILAGWTFVDRIAEYDIIYASKKAYLKEDPEEMKKKKETIQKTLGSFIVYGVIALSALSGLGRFIREGTVFRIDWVTVFWSPTIVLFYVIFELFLVLGVILQGYKYRMTQKVVNPKTSADKRAWNYEHYTKVRKFVTGCIIVMFVGIIAVAALEFNQNDDGVSAEDIECCPLLQQSELHELGYLGQIEEFCEEDSNVFLTKRYNYQALVDDYKLIVAQYYYELRFEGIRTGVIKSLFEDEDPLEIEAEGVDRAYYKANDDGNVTEMAVCKDNKILYVEVAIGVEREQLLSLMTKKLQ